MNHQRVWREHFCGLEELVAECILDTEPGTLITIHEGEDPENPDQVFEFIVPHWGDA